VPVGTSLDHYQIQVATDLGFDGSTIVRDQNVNTSEYVPDTPLAPNAKYYWRVRSFNTIGHYSSWSLVRYFRAAMRAPVPVTPEDASSPTSLHPIFNWQSVDGATSYTIQISRYRDFSTYLVGVSVLSPTYTPAASLPRGVDLYWRVRANGPNGPSFWSTVFQFQIP
jgi:hypothetical protein